MYTCGGVRLPQAEGKSGGAFSLTGMKSRLFGAESPEQRETKLKQLDDDIEECEAKVKLAKEELE